MTYTNESLRLDGLANEACNGTSDSYVDGELDLLDSIGICSVLQCGFANSETIVSKCSFAPSSSSFSERVESAVLCDIPVSLVETKSICRMLMKDWDYNRSTRTREQPS